MFVFEQFDPAPRHASARQPPDPRRFCVRVRRTLPIVLRNYLMASLRNPARNKLHADHRAFSGWRSGFAERRWPACCCFRSSATTLRGTSASISPSGPARPPDIRRLQGESARLGREPDAGLVTARSSPSHASRSDGQRPARRNPGEREHRLPTQTCSMCSRCPSRSARSTAR